MLLALDVGNSHIHGGLFYKAMLLLQFRYDTKVLYENYDSIGTYFTRALRNNGLKPSDIKEVAIVSVVDDTNKILKYAIIKYFNLIPYFITFNIINKDISFNATCPNKIGLDRIVSCVAANYLFPEKNILIINLGTATVFDVIRKDKKYFSGAILPGVKTTLNALKNISLPLEKINLIQSPAVIGENTKENLQSGMYYGYVGALKEIKKSTIKAINIKNEEIFTIATGGFSYLFDTDNIFDMIISDLVIQGIKIAFIKK